VSPCCRCACQSGRAFYCAIIPGKTGIPHGSSRRHVTLSTLSTAEDDVQDGMAHLNHDSVSSLKGVRRITDDERDRHSAQQKMRNIRIQWHPSASFIPLEYSRNTTDIAVI
jgi:hypothetical protein